MQRVLRSVSDLVTGLVYVAGRFPLCLSSFRGLASGRLERKEVDNVAGSMRSALTRPVALRGPLACLDLTGAVRTRPGSCTQTRWKRSHPLWPTVAWSALSLT